ncbi:MAG: nucleotidyltransferase domain-containing protein [Synechococcus sp. Tobar2m-G35]|jgi:predicted nucleotidyltransferase|nr:nucleotidyltransferase domain-containing protein [Synechococcus sp. Tobar2m-G35]
MADPASEPISAIPGLPAEASARLLALLCDEPAVREVWLYGSRAMGRHRPGSDIDLTLVAPGLSHGDRLRLMAAIDDLLLPWSLDLSLHHDLPDSLRRHVARVGRRLVPPS